MLNLLRKWFGPAPTGCPSCDIRRSAMQSLHASLEIARMAQSNQSRRINALRHEHPELHRLFFAKAGDAERGVTF